MTTKVEKKATNRPLTIEEMLANGGLAGLHVMDQSDAELSRLGKTADEIEARYTAADEPRRVGRPRKEAFHEETAVRGLRLRLTKWKKLEFYSDKGGSSVNRLIEEAVDDKLLQLAQNYSFPDIEISNLWQVMRAHISLTKSPVMESVSYELAKAG